MNCDIETVVEEYEETEVQRFNRIYMQCQEHIYRQTLRMTNGDTFLAEDVVQETLEVFYKNGRSVIPGKERAWLLEVARNLTLNILQKNRKIVLGDEEVMDCADVNCPVIAAEDSFLEQEERRKKKEAACSIFKCLREKNEKWYQVLVELYLFDKSVHEVAKEQGISEDTVRHYVHRTRKWIRKTYGETISEMDI